MHSTKVCYDSTTQIIRRITLAMNANKAKTKTKSNAKPRPKKVYRPLKLRKCSTEPQQQPLITSYYLMKQRHARRHINGSNSNSHSRSRSVPGKSQTLPTPATAPAMHTKSNDANATANQTNPINYYDHQTDHCPFCKQTIAFLSEIQKSHHINACVDSVLLQPPKQQENCGLPYFDGGRRDGPSSALASAPSSLSSLQNPMAYLVERYPSLLKSKTHSSPTNSNTNSSHGNSSNTNCSATIVLQKKRKAKSEAWSQCQSQSQSESDSGSDSSSLIVISGGHRTSAAKTTAAAAPATTINNSNGSKTRGTATINRSLSTTDIISSSQIKHGHIIISNANRNTSINGRRKRCPAKPKIVRRSLFHNNKQSFHAFASAAVVNKHKNKNKTTVLQQQQPQQHAHTSHSRRKSQSVPMSSLQSPQSQKRRNWSDAKHKRLHFAEQFKIIGIDGGKTNIIVDGFNCKSIFDASDKMIYFLSHFHSDHYSGLNQNFNAGPIYCSEITANLVQTSLGVNAAFIHRLPMNERCVVKDSRPLTYVTLLEANHCPGAVMFFFEVENEAGVQSTATNNAENNRNNNRMADSAPFVKYLHVGDFRCEFDEHSLFQTSNAAFLQQHIYNQNIAALYLDTTYCDIHKSFPRQSDITEYVANKCRLYLNDYGYGNDCADDGHGHGHGHGFGHAKKHNNTNTHEDVHLQILIGTYKIGKERILEKVSQVCNTRIYASAEKRAILQQVYKPNKFERYFTSSLSETPIRVVNMGHCSFSHLWEYTEKYNKHNAPANSDVLPRTRANSGRKSVIVAFSPTGWACNEANANANGNANTSSNTTYIEAKTQQSDGNKYFLYRVPYSEHSSFVELCKFVSDVNPKSIIPTVDNRSDDAVVHQIDLLKKYKTLVHYEYGKVMDKIETQLPITAFFG